jgi:hypothetical protein
VTYERKNNKAAGGIIRSVLLLFKAQRKVDEYLMVSGMDNNNLSPVNFQIVSQNPKFFFNDREQGRTRPKMNIGLII